MWTHYCREEQEEIEVGNGEECNWCGLDAQGITVDGFDEAILGMCIQFGTEPIVSYDYEKCLTILMERDGMDRSDAIDFMQFNVIGAYVGLHTPVFIMI